MFPDPSSEAVLPCSIQIEALKHIEGRTRMKKALKRIGKILLGIVAVIAVFLLGTCVYDKICLAYEKDLLENQIYGQKVEVDGHRMSVYVSGEGKHTLVFMAGSGDSGPIFSFKDFADRFALVEIKRSALEMVQLATQNKIGRFTKQDIRELTPSLSISSIEGALRKLVASGELIKEGMGKNTCYYRIK